MPGRGETWRLGKEWAAEVVYFVLLSREIDKNLLVGLKMGRDKSRCHTTILWYLAFFFDPLAPNSAKN